MTEEETSMTAKITPREQARHRPPRRLPFKTEQRRALMRSLRAEGLLQREIAELLGVSLSTVGEGLDAERETATVASSADRFMARVEVVEGADGCWLWTGCVNAEGYGQCRLDRKVRLAHRYAYELFVGPIPEGHHLDHLCRVRECANPAHLEPVTPRENSLRSENRLWRAHREDRCLRGHSLADSENVYVRPNGTRICRACRVVRGEIKS